MTSTLNGSLHPSEPKEAATERTPLDAAWHEHFLNLVQRAPRFDGPRRSLQKDLATAFGQLVHHDASVLEAGVGGGKLLGSLPNAVRWGVDILPEAVNIARELDPTMHLLVADATTMQLGRQFDAIICDRLCHSVPDIQRLLENLAAHLTPNGRIFFVAFNFLRTVPTIGWSSPWTCLLFLDCSIATPPASRRSSSFRCTASTRCASARSGAPHPRSASSSPRATNRETSTPPSGARR